MSKELTDEQCQELWDNASADNPIVTDSEEGKQVMDYIKRQNDLAACGLDSPMINSGSNYNYTSPVDGTQITNRKEHREHMNRHDLVDIGNEYKSRLNKGED